MEAEVSCAADAAKKSNLNLKFADGTVSVTTSFRKNILEKGGSDDPMKLYVTFRGAEPSLDALLKTRGLK